ncbi:hypothetical protein GCM10007415_25270 [Parapedobacter pyrenivorans]|uniref:GIY-YIG domain-containing protein n=1 Tax=Parapedobacter pyrenivorans TaxID=1305674 RepID=A0A917HUR5_9SPHI|nr:hypothetical protein [Parapedobacter pyrenivorans]GGG89893.1 hypothetical protein GCM10007415_25270 [Parapedobacter pyrenivorans]
MGYIKYISEENVKKLLGRRFPLGLKRVINLLDQYLNHLDDNGDPLPGELLFHNISKKRNRDVSEFAKVDADMVLELNSLSKKLTIDLRDYRVHPQFARDYKERRVVLHILIKDVDKTTWAIHLPLQSLMVGFGDPMLGYHCYGHGISFLDDNGQPKEENEVFYCGITKRGWLTRMTEHFRDIKGNSNKTFHKLWREYLGDTNVLLNSELIALNHSYEAAMGWEEWIVEKYMAKNRSLNMIPGGFAGRGAYSCQNKISDLAGENSIALGQSSFLYFANQSRHGIKNPMIEKLWQDDKYYAKVIGNRENTFSFNEVIKIRQMADKGYDAKQIGRHLGITALKRITNLLSGKTYKRM